MILRPILETSKPADIFVFQTKPVKDEQHDVGKAQQSDHDPAREARGNLRLPLCRRGRLDGVRVEGEAETTSGCALRDRLRRCVPAAPVGVAASSSASAEAQEQADAADI